MDTSADRPAPPATQRTVPAESGAAPTRRALPARFWAAAFAAVAALAVLLYGGYRLGWAWTGFGDNDHLWDYLQLLVLPVVLATLPIWLRTHREAMTRWRLLIGGALAAAAAIVAGGYLLGWEWTGFASKTLWDWLDLLILPVVVSLMPLWLETHRRLESRWIAALSATIAVFAVLVVGGYGLGWAWTGFEGNTFWDWLHLLLVPFALPAGLTWYQVSARRAAAEPRADAGPGARVEHEAPGPEEAGEAAAAG